MDATSTLLPRASTGIDGLDAILGGGLARNRLHLLEGSPGTGKTTIALQFLLAGAEAGEAGIYVSLAETENELRDGARSHGWSIDSKIEIFELVPPESVLDPDQHQSLLYSSDLELGETVQRIFASIERLKPKRIVIDSLSEIRLLAQSSLRYRRQILALKHYFAQHNSTVIMLDDLTTESTDRAVHSIAHSVIHLDQLTPIYGGERRRLRVVKCRGQPFLSGSTISSSVPAGFGFSRGWSLPNTASHLPAGSCNPAYPRSINCSVAASSPVRARSLSDRLALASRFFPCTTSMPPSHAANAPRCSFSTRSLGSCWRAQKDLASFSPPCAPKIPCSSSRWMPRN